MVNVLQAGEAETKAWRACNYKEGKTFPVLFDGRRHGGHAIIKKGRLYQYFLMI